VFVGSKQAASLEPLQAFKLGPSDAALILGGIMLAGLLFVVCVILQFHYHDPIPWYIWVLALIALLVSFGEPAMRSAIKSKKDDRSRP
jgi:4-hydroxybenzoate polyprenyltransferase